MWRHSRGTVLCPGLGITFFWGVEGGGYQVRRPSSPTPEPWADAVFRLVCLLAPDAASESFPARGSRLLPGDQCDPLTTLPAHHGLSQVLPGALAKLLVQT